MQYPLNVKMRYILYYKVLLYLIKRQMLLPATKQLDCNEYIILWRGIKFNSACHIYYKLHVESKTSQLLLHFKVLEVKTTNFYIFCESKRLQHHEIQILL